MSQRLHNGAGLGRPDHRAAQWFFLSILLGYGLVSSSRW